ncbi:YceD family protein [Psychromicrobium silvestre]|uniref:YceD family protein n=1 Tax=Psychromicrobium silvestre TaxID=1645614 RepID=UPI0015CBA221|nr:YceD family protein [Psychromicrobium silvestre]
MVIAVKDFARNPGGMRNLEETVPAPGELSVAMIGVQEGSEVDLDLSLEAVHEGIFVSGTASVHVVGECSRCLDPLAYDLDVDIQEMFFFEGLAPVRAAKEDDNESLDDEQRLVENDHIDLEPLLRDVVVTALPFRPVCREDCQGLCSVCGIRLADEPGHHHEDLDPRWAALSGLAEDQEN